MSFMKSHCKYISHAMSYLYETDLEIWAGLGRMDSLEFFRLLRLVWVAFIIILD